MVTFTYEVFLGIWPCIDLLEFVEATFLEKEWDGIVSRSCRSPPEFDLGLRNAGTELGLSTLSPRSKTENS